MIFDIRAALLLAGGFAGAVLSHPGLQDVATEQALAEDGECSGEEADACAVNALQLRAGKGPGSPLSGKVPSNPLLPPRKPAPKPPIFSSLSPIVVKGNYLYDSGTGKRWFSKGTSYNPRSAHLDENGRSKGTCEGETGDAKTVSYTADIISDEFEYRWGEDLVAIANLGANTVRLFNVDAGQDHTKFMSKAASLGLYVILPLNSKDFGFLPAFESPRCYTEYMDFNITAADGSQIPYGNVGVNVLSYGKQIVKQFSKFNNTLFFTVNNEFAMDKNGFAGFQCVKALTRDIHQYQRSCSESMRRVPLIYSDYDMGHPDRALIAKYLTCAVDSEDDAIDVYGLNAYSYCNKTYPGNGHKDWFPYSPYGQVRDDYKHLSVPMLFTEFGCIEGEFVSKCPYKGGRTWPDVRYFFDKYLGEIVSGAIAYTYEQDYEERGLVLTPGFLKDQPELYLLDSYFTLRKQFLTHTVSPAWDGANITDCAWTPAEAAPQRESHARHTCPSTAAGKALMKRRKTDKLSDWHELPPTPEAPLSNINGQSECPEDISVDAVMAQEAKCHAPRAA